MKRLELTDFESHTGTTFSFHRVMEMPSLLASQNNSSQMRTEEISAELTLTEIKPYTLDPRDGRATDTSGKLRKEPFSLFFEDERTDYLPQGLYVVSHPSFAEPLDIFIVPLGPNEKGTGFLYEAAFG